MSDWLAEIKAWLAEVKARSDVYNGKTPLIILNWGASDCDKVEAVENAVRRAYERQAPADLARLVGMVEALDKQLTVTPEKVEAAAKAGHEAWDEEDWEELTDSWKDEWRRVALAALLAAGMEEKK